MQAYQKPSKFRLEEKEELQVPFTSQELNEFASLIVIPGDTGKQLAKTIKRWSFKNVTLVNDTRVFHQSNSLDVGLVMLPKTLAEGESLPVLLRHITHNKLIPDWAKVVLVDDESDESLQAMPYRYLRTEKLPDPNDEDTLYRIVRFTLDGQKILKHAIQMAEKYSPRELLQAMKEAQNKQLPEPLATDLNLLKARFLFINGMREIALAQAGGMSGADKVTATSIMHFLSCDFAALTHALGESEQYPGFKDKALCYQIMVQLVQNPANDFAGISSLVEQLSKDTAYVQLTILLAYLQKGLAHAEQVYDNHKQTFIDSTHVTVGGEFIFIITMVLACLEGSGSDAKRAQGKLVEVLKSRDKTKPYYSKYTALLNMLTLSVLSSSGPAKIREQFTAIHSKSSRHPNVVVHLLQAAIASVLGQYPQAVESLFRVDRLVAGLEPSPELVCIELLWRHIAAYLSQGRDGARVYADVAGLLHQDGIKYRSTRRIATACRLDKDFPDYRLRLAEYMVQVKFTQFLQFKLSELLASAADKNLTEQQRESLKKVQRQAEQIFADSQ